MSGPWDKYKTEEDKGPWSKYSQPTKTEILEEDKGPLDISMSGLARGATEALPAIGGLVGGALGSAMGPLGAVGGGAGGYALGSQAKDIIGQYAFDKPITKSLPERAVQVGQDALTGATQEMGGQVLGNLISRGANALSGPVSNSIRKAAESRAVSATGATGKQASTFADDAGAQLLDRNLVKFGDSPENIADRLNSALSESGSKIDEILKSSTQKISPDDLMSRMDTSISAFNPDPSKADIVRKLATIKQDMAASYKDGPPLSVLAAEQTKRGYKKIAGNWADPSQGQAGKEAYNIYKNAVERAVDNPTLFKEQKELYGLLSPIEEAASRRAATLNQSPSGGLLDTTTAIGGLLSGNPVTAVAAPVARRAIAPRIDSSTAVGLNKISRLLKEAPQTLGRFAEPLSRAAAAGGNQLAVQHFLLGNKDSEYQDITKDDK